MKKAPLAALLLGLAAGFGASRLLRPQAAPSAPPPIAVATGRSGPGLSCPAAAGPELLASEDPVAMDQSESRSLGSRPGDPPAMCTTNPTAHGHLILDGRGDPHVVGDDVKFWFAYYKSLPPTPMGTSSVINGGVMQIAQLATPDDPNEVLAFYRRQLELNHITPIGSLLEGNSGPYTMSLPGNAAPMRTLTLVPSAHGTVMLASVGSPNMDKAFELPDDFPAPKGMREVRVNTIQDGATEQRNMSFIAPGSVEDVRTFYLKQLPEMGFSDEDMPWRNDFAQAWSHTFRRGEESLSLNLNKRNDKAVQVTVLWVAQTDSKEPTP